MQTCPLCRASGLRTDLPGAVDYLTGLAFDVVVCPTCSAAFTDIADAPLDRHYPRQYRRYHPLILALLRGLYRLRVRGWADGFAHPGLALEIGCADGFMLDALRGSGWRVVGSERSAAVLRVAAAAGIPVFAGEPNALAARPTFDLIILFQVLEHLPNPSETLAELSARLNPGGRLVIGVPNKASWQAAFGGAQWFHLDVPRHLSHFTPAALATALGQAGLVVRRICYTSFEHDPYGWLQTALNRLDTRQNRLTRLLMRLDGPDVANLAHLAVAVLLGPLAVVVALISWWFKRGAIIEVVAEKVGDA